MPTTKLYERACRFLPGGVNSPVRAGRAVGADPVIATSAKGSKVWDQNGRELVDYIGSWGPALLGHAHREVVQAVQKAAKDGLSFGLLTKAEVDAAELVCKLVPGIEMIRFVNSGTEAAMSAARLVRGFTKRRLLLIFEGGYHGHADAFLAGGGSGLATFGIPKSPGVTEATASETIVVPYNDLDAVRAAFQNHPNEIAGIFVEPVAGNMGVIPPESGFLEGLREICTRNSALLVFDEVMTGFRIAPGGAQEYYMVLPDLTLLGKILGGGMPMAAYGGRKDIMEMIAPAGPVYQAGTLSGNPIATAAAVASLSLLHDLDLYVQLEKRCKTLQEGLEQSLNASGITGCVQRVCSMLTLFFHPGPLRSFADVKQADAERYASFWRGMFQEGILLPPSAFEAWFVSSAHAPRDIQRTIKATETVLTKIAAGETFPAKRS